MKVLLDTCVWGGAVGDLRSAGHDVIWAGEWYVDPGDEEIPARAHAEGRVLITLDKIKSSVNLPSSIEFPIQG